MNERDPHLDFKKAKEHRQFKGAGLKDLLRILEREAVRYAPRAGGRTGDDWGVATQWRVLPSGAHVGVRRDPDRDSDAGQGFEITIWRNNGKHDARWTKEVETFLRYFEIETVSKGIRYETKLTAERFGYLRTEDPE